MGKELNYIKTAEVDITQATPMMKQFLDIKNFNTSLVTSMVSMFEGCSSLEYLNLFNFETGNVVKILNTERQKYIKCPIPPQKEQKLIVEYLDEKCSQIEDLLKMKQQKIEELKEYKKSLIYEYVTGKRRVV